MDLCDDEKNDMYLCVLLSWNCAACSMDRTDEDGEDCGAGRGTLDTCMGVYEACE